MEKLAHLLFMLIYLLFFALLVNLLWAYKAMKCVIAPPVLYGIGFVAASLVCCLYYNEWGLNTFQVQTFAVIIIGNFLMTGVSVIFYNNRNNLIIVKKSFGSLFKEYRLKSLLFTFIFIRIFICVMKIRYYKNVFGDDLSLSELLFAYRINSFMGEDAEIVFPSWFANMSQLCSAFYFFESYLLTIYILLKGKTRILLILIVINMVLQNMISLFDGARGGVLYNIGCTFFIFVMKYLKVKQKKDIPLKYKKRVLLCSLFLVALLKVSADFVGRDNADMKSQDIIAEYCGAEIKNLDDFIRNPKESPVFGEATFSVFVNRFIDSKKNVEEYLYYNSYGQYSLGNVFTTYLNFYVDGKMGEAVRKL